MTTKRRTYRSRHQRPAQPTGLGLQPRDRLILSDIYRHRYLLARHMAQLRFGGSLRPAQLRLRKLWEHHYLDRRFLPIQFEGGVRLSPPLYSLALKGAEVVACDINVAVAAVPHTPKANAHGFATVQHNLVATDLLVAAECLNTKSLAFETEQEFALRRRVATARDAKTWVGPAIVPDAALTFISRGNEFAPDGPARAAQTYYVEVVRAGVRAGNATLARKLALYADLHHRGYFRQVFGHAHVRAVLILTTAAERAEHFRQLAQQLRHGRNLFWFGVFTARGSGSLALAVTGRYISAQVWRDVDDQPVAISGDGGRSK